MNHIQPQSTKVHCRITHPTRFEFERYGSLVKVVNDDDTADLYIQVSKDPECAQWITVSRLFAETECFSEQQIHDALREYDAKRFKEEIAKLL